MARAEEFDGVLRGAVCASSAFVTLKEFFYYVRHVTLEEITPYLERVVELFVQRGRPSEISWLEVRVCYPYLSLGKARLLSGTWSVSRWESLDTRCFWNRAVSSTGMWNEGVPCTYVSMGPEASNQCSSETCTVELNPPRPMIVILGGFAYQPCVQLRFFSAGQAHATV